MKIEYPSHYFEPTSDLLPFVITEIKKYIGKTDSQQVVARYNRMTVEELAQEVIAKIWKTTSEQVNKSYVRNTLKTVCIDMYRKHSDKDQQINESVLTQDQVYKETERDLQMRRFHLRDLEIIKYMRQGYKHREIMKLMGLPKMTYYTSLNRLKARHI